MPGDPSTMLNSNPATMIPGLALGAAQTVVGLVNAGKAAREAKELAKSRPNREISPLYEENLSLAESELAGGMSAAAEAAYNNQLDKSTSASLGAILRGGGSVNNVADIFAGGEEGRQRLALLNDQLRLSQIDTVMKARDMMGQEQDKNFIFNDWMPWKDAQTANAEARKSANDAIWSGLGTVAGAGMSMLGAGGGGANSGGGMGLGAVNMAPNGQQMWLDYKKQMEMDNAKQGDWVLPPKFSTETRQQQQQNIPSGGYGFNTSGLYNFLNRPR